MLRSFRVGNHRSIHAEQELILLPGSAKPGPMLTVAGIFGANAAGKSNLLDALRFMRSAVRSSYAAWEPGTGVPRDPFRLASAASGETSIFVVDLELDEVRYMYGFEVDDQRIEAEWLYSYPQSRKRVIFERENESVSFGSTLREGRSRAGLLSQMLRPNALFLSLAARAEQKEMLPVYRWFQENLHTAQGGRLADPLLEDSLIALHDRSPADRNQLLSLVKAADLGVVDLEVVEDPMKAAVLGAASGASLLFLHGPNRIPLPLSKQSQGTLAWLDLGIRALAVLQSGGLLVVDELDSSLHPRLAADFVTLFSDETLNSRAAQLVFTTHDATLLGSHNGAKTLARDHIWFVEKDRDGATTLYPLTDFHPRKEENTERRYLGGSYRAVPMYAAETLVELAESLSVDRAQAS